MTWITVILTPMLLTFDMLDELVAVEKQSGLHDKMMWLVWLNDISWCFEIFFNFFTASPKERTFTKIACKYLKGFFILDVLATIPPMVTLQMFTTINLLKFLRLLHFGEMFLPVKALIDCLMSNSIAKKRNDVF